MVDLHGTVEAQEAKSDDFEPAWATAAGVWGKQIRTALVTSPAHSIIRWTLLDWRWTTAAGVMGGTLIWTPFTLTAQKVSETLGRTTAAGVGVLLTRTLLKRDDDSGGGSVGGDVCRRRRDAGVARLLSQTLERVDRRRHHVGAGWLAS